jgi:adenosyl cobinamide kinase/adenosyl cobinamide phosphate guanylyltransferase
MYIQGYQIHNVLSVFRRQLSQNDSDRSQYAGGLTSDLEAVTVSAAGKKKVIMEKVAASVFKKITDVAPGSVFDRQKSLPVQASNQRLHTAQLENEFKFRSIVANNRREIRSIAIDSLQGLMNQLDELAKAAVKHNTDPNVRATRRKLNSQKGR